MDRNLASSILLVIGLGINCPVHSVPTDCSLYPSQLKEELTNVVNDLFFKIKNAEMKTGGFRQKAFGCEIKVKADGSITDLKISKTSGSEKDDEDFLSIIRLAGPFSNHSSKFGELVYAIDFFDHVSTSAMNIQSDFNIRSIEKMSPAIAKKSTMMEQHPLDAFRSSK